MSDQARKDTWNAGAAYEPYVGRWSRLVGHEFIGWLGVPAGKRWLDVGCGTGALTQTILAVAEPLQVTGIDQSAGYVAYAREQVNDARAHFETADAQQLPVTSGTYDAVVSGLVLNFVPDVAKAAREMLRAAASGGTVAAYVWDYADKMELMRYFWDAAVELNPDANALDEGRRFPICKPEPLAALFQDAGLAQVEVRSIDVPTHFRDFDDYWTPFLGGQGPAPSYVASLNEPARDMLRDEIRLRLPTNADGSIGLIARAWAVRASKP